MTPDRAKDLLPLFEHFANGGEIQSQPDSALADVDLAWRDNPDPKWCIDCMYRKKPEPRIQYINFYDSGSNCAHDTPERAINSSHGDGETAVKFVEVLDETD